MPMVVAHTLLEVQTAVGAVASLNVLVNQSFYQQTLKVREDRRL
jgi:hypothetical protein